MQKFRLIFIGMLGTALLVAQSVGAQPVGQQGQLRPSDSTLYSAITMDCLEVKLKLTKVHEDDGLLRVTAGESYAHVADKLMARLNTEIAERRLDGGQLIDTAATFESQLNDFRSNYQVYEVAMSNLLKMDCRSQQQSFYIELDQTRSKREEVVSVVEQLDTTMKTYKEEFLQFKQTHLENRAQEAQNE